MKFESKSYPLNSTIENTEKGIVHAVVSIFGNTDAHGDIVEKGAFENSISQAKVNKKLPPGIFYHDWTKPIAKTLDAWEENDGLHVIGKFNLETQRGKETFSDIKAGIITEYSFGFQVKKHKNIDGVRHLLDLDWYEWSPVLIGANRKTYTAEVKENNFTFDRLEAHRSALISACQGFLEHLNHFENLKLTKKSNKTTNITCPRQNLKTDLKSSVKQHLIQLDQNKTPLEIIHQKFNRIYQHITLERILLGDPLA